MSYLLTPKALELIKSTPNFLSSYTLIEGEYIYARDGRIVRVDAPARTAETTKEPPAPEASALEAKKTKRSKNESSTFENDAFSTKNNNTDESENTI
jgi:hypothetical protein